jgi:hypothetical protein
MRPLLAHKSLRQAFEIRCSCKYLNAAAVKLVPSDENKQLVETQAPINYTKGMKIAVRNSI